MSKAADHESRRQRGSAAYAAIFAVPEQELPAVFAALMTLLAIYTGYARASQAMETVQRRFGSDAQDGSPEQP